MIPRSGIFFSILLFLFLHNYNYCSSTTSHISGLPIIFNYAPSTYGYEPQNWGASQDSRGIMYFANTEGILEYDGVSWRVIRLPKGETCRALHRASDGTLYVAGFNEIGKLQLNSSGNAEYHSLKSKIPAESNNFSDVWLIAELNGKIYFSTYDRIFVYDGNTFTVINSLRYIISMRTINGSLVILRKDEQPRTLSGSQFIPLQSEEFTLPGEFYMSLPSDDGGFIFITKTGVFYKLLNSGYEELSDGFTHQGYGSSFYDALVLSNGDFAIASLESGLILTDKKGQLKQVIKQETGLGRNTIYALFEDKEGNLWMMLENGISRININSPISIFDSRTGLPGAAFSSVFYKDRLFVGTNFGVYTSKLEGTNFGTPFEKVSKNISDSWDFLSYRNNIYLNTGSGFFLIDDNREILIDSSYCFTATSVSDDSSLILLGTDSGVKLIQMDQKGERAVVSRIIEGISGQLKKIVQHGPREFWIQIEPRTVIRMRFVNGYLNPPKVDFFEDDFTGTGFNPTLMELNNELYAVTVKGIYYLDSQKDTFLSLNNTGLQQVKNLYTVPLFSVINNQNIILYLEGIIYSVEISPTDFSCKFSQLGRVRTASIYGISTNFHAPNREIWLSSTTGLIKFDAGTNKFKSDISAIFRSFQIGDSLYFSGVTRDGDLKDIPPGSNITVNFAAPGFQDEFNIMYQTWVQGLDTNWTQPGRNSFREFYNMQPGNYLIKVRAILSSGQVSSEAVYSLEVDSFWYANFFAYLLYTLILIGLIILFIKIRTAEILKERDDLEGLVSESAAELKKANQELSFKNVQLQRINSQLEKLDREKNEYLGIVAHDLRNPISGIMGFAEIITDEEEELEKTDITRFAENIRVSCASMLETLNKILNMNLVEQGKLDLHPENFDLVELINELKDRNHPASERKNIKLKAELPDNLFSFSDRNFTGQIIDNLISNAIKYSFHGSSIDIRLNESDGFAIVEVEDHGQGIPEEEVPNVFKRFAKISSSPTAGESSAGMGLSIVQMLVNLLKGTIECESRVGFGTLFTVRLPLKIEDL
ncbi:MAG: hypothetical protein LCH52_04990 [Bacteroidetes bacterium]|nr:hypothetical protein [Bacteroidota bacterium]